MKIKHFSGYGCVNAKKISCTKFKDVFDQPFYKLTILVKGNHEQGLVRNDRYDLCNWLVNRFMKNIEEKDIANYVYDTGEVKEDGIDVETCQYVFIIKDKTEGEHFYAY